MAIYMFVDVEDEEEGGQTRISNAYWYNEFLNWVAEMGEYPQLLDHSPIHGAYELDDRDASLYDGSVYRLWDEVNELKTFPCPEFVEIILEQIGFACFEALSAGKRITMDNQGWKGEGEVIGDLLPKE